MCKPIRWNPIIAQEPPVVLIEVRGGLPLTCHQSLTGCS